jgi:hypothetical protein
MCIDSDSKGENFKYANYSDYKRKSRLFNIFISTISLSPEAKICVEARQGTIQTAMFAG